MFSTISVGTFLLHLCNVALVSSQKALSKSSGPPAFFLQDPNDGLCLAGDKYRRCAIDTLWYVTGKPGTYQIHHRLVDETDEGSCLDKTHCHLDESDVGLSNCNHCGAKKWNILGDAETGYVLTEDGNKNCVKRVGDKATMIKCDKGYTGISLQFATKDDITAMSSDGARLITAATDNDEKSVKVFLSEKVDINSRDWDQLTPLIAASGKGHLSMAKFLVSKGADPNLKDKDNITALMEAAMGGHKDIVDFLAGKGAIIDSPAASGVTALWLAAGDGHKAVVNLLLGKKADPNNKRMDGITALMAACSSGHNEIVNSLLAAGADATAKDKEGLTALISASENGSIPIVKSLLNYKADVNVLSDTGFSPLIIASAHGHTEVASMLIKAGAEIDMEHPESVTPLMYAAAGGFPEVVKMLLDKGAAVNLRHKQGGSALMEGATAGNVSVIEILLKAGADPMILDEDGVTALMSAASQGHTDLARIFISKGIEVNKIANSGGTALMFAAGGGHNETTRLLLDFKADPNIVVQAKPEYILQVIQKIADKKEDAEPHKDGVTALHVAAQGGHIGTVTMLVEAGATIRVADDEGMTPLLNAVKGNYGNVASYLVQQGADPNDVFVDEKSKKHNLLMDAVVVTNKEFALLLIEKGANISHADAEGVTVTTQAAYQGLLPIVEALIAKGADVTVMNNEGINPLIAAASEGHHEIVKALLLHGKGDVNAKDKDGTNALMAASVRGHKEVVSQLLDVKCEVNAQNVDGHTALMFAYNGKNQVEVLLDKYSEYMKESNDNSTRIIKEALQTHVEVVQLLIKGGADLTIKDSEGHVAVDFDYKAPVAVADTPAVAALEGSIMPDKEL